MMDSLFNFLVNAGLFFLLLMGFIFVLAFVIGAKRARRAARRRNDDT